MTTRAAFATALSTVDGITGAEYRPSVLATGVAWAQVGFNDRSSGFVITTWNVFVILPSDERSAQIFYDGHIAAIREALESGDVAYVDRDEPAIYQTDNGDFNAMLITARSE